VKFGHTSKEPSNRTVNSLKVTSRQGRIDRGEETVVGVNMYRVDAVEDSIEVLDIDNDEVRKQRIARLNNMRSTH